MKVNVGLFTLLCGSFLTFAACSSDDEKDIQGNVPNTQIVNSFNKQFPNATNVKWSNRDGYSVASFSLIQKTTENKNEAWYTSNGDCALSEIDILNFSDLPQIVQDGYNATTYAIDTWEIDDMEMLTRQGMALVYKIEVEKAGQPDHDLLFSAEGVLVSDKIDTDNDQDENRPVIIPTEVLDFINKHISGAVLVNFDKEDNGEFEAEITYKNTPVDLYFTPAYKFLRAEMEISENELPEAIMDALTQYTTEWEVDDVTMITYANKSVIYQIELDNRTTDTEKTLTFKADGTLIP